MLAKCFAWGLTHSQDSVNALKSIVMTLLGSIPQRLICKSPASEFLVVKIPGSTRDPMKQDP